MRLKLFLKGFTNWAKHNSTKILAGGAVVSQWIALWFMHREAPIVKERLKELNENATWKDKAKIIIPVYWPAVGMMLLASGCVIGGCAVGEKKAAIMASLYSASEASLCKLEKEIVDHVGKDKAQEIHDAVADDMMKEHPPTPENIEHTGYGMDLFWEPWTGRWFTTSIDAFEENNRKFKKYVLTNMWGSMNDWFEQQNLSKAEAGDYVGWHVEHQFDAFTVGEERVEDRKLYHVIRYMNKPVLYDGKAPLEFARWDDCIPPR